MDRFGITGSELAKILNIHHSLVSKWRNNRRELRPHLNKITDYFLTLDSYTKYHTLKGILKDYYPDAALESAETIAIFLKQWLSNSQDEQNDSDFLFKTKNSKNVYRAQFDVYKNNKGRREAVLQHLDIILSLPEGQELLVFSEEDIAWLLEDADFLAVWEEKYLEIIRKGTHITIIHSVNRQSKSLLHTLIQWLPLHMTGNTSPYYYPKYATLPLKRFISIIRDKAVLTSTSVEGFSKTLYTYFYFDTITIHQHQNIFDSIFSECRPLLENFSSDQTIKLFENILKAERKHENSFFYNKMPFFSVLSKDTFNNILMENNFDKKKLETFISYYNTLNELFHKNIKKNYYRYIYDLSALEQIVTSEVSINREISLLTGFQINVSVNHFREHIHHIICLLEENQNFEIALISEPPIASFKGISLWIKENTITIATKEGDSNLSSLISEPTVVNAFYQYYDNYWDSIPLVQRNKDWVKKRLLELVSNNNH